MELRWLDKANGVVRLQYREGEWFIPWGVNERTSDLPLPGWKFRWKEWQDVPSVQELIAESA
jgi:hypothetical protein